MSDTMIEHVEDVLCMAVPANIKPNDPRAQLLVYSSCVTYVHRQFHDLPENERPSIFFDRIDTMMTDSFDEAESFQPAHDCEECREGVKRTQDYLRDNPGHFVALANIYYRSVM